MRHRSAGIKLNRTPSHRKAMFRNMVTSLFKYERIRTTDAKAKEIRRWADKLVTLAKRGDLHARRQAMSIIREKDVVHKLFAEAPARFAQTNGGYTRVVKVGFRPGDAAPISMVELVTPEVKKKKARRKKKSQKDTTPSASATATVAADAADGSEAGSSMDESPSADTASTVETAAAEKQADGDDPAATTEAASPGEVEKQVAEASATEAAPAEAPDGDAAPSVAGDVDPEETPPEGR